MSTRDRGFTLIELVVALMLLALMSSVLFGSLQLAGRSWDGGEAKVAQVTEMRATQQFLREQLAGAYPQRLPKATACSAPSATSTRSSTPSSAARSRSSRRTSASR